MPLSQLDKFKLDFYRKRWGDLFPASSDEALSLALEAEDTKRALSPDDPAALRFFQEQQQLEEVALLLEKEAS